MKKRILLAMLAMGLVVSTPEMVTVHAEEISGSSSVSSGDVDDVIIEDDNLYYKNYVCSIRYDQTLWISKYTEKEGETDIIIPSEINGMPVTEIGTLAFRNCSNLTSVTIPNGVTEISYGAFEGCTRLQSVSVPASVTSIQYDAFNGTEWQARLQKENQFVIVNDILLNGQVLKGEVKIPDGVKSIEDYAFQDCSEITSVTIPDSVNSIGMFAFDGCSGLTNIEIPNSVTAIAPYAFSWCSGLTSITIPESVVHIGNDILEGSNNIKDIYFGGTKEQLGEAWTCPWGDSNYHYFFSVGTIHYGKESVPQTIPLGKIVLEETKITYTGDKERPYFSVWDCNGDYVIWEGEAYTTVIENNKNVGLATMTVTGIGDYSGTLTANFDILPEGTKLSNLKAGKKSIDVQWKKRKKQVDGYEIQYATSKEYGNAKTVTVNRKKIASTTIDKLKANKKYYVRIRTYKKVKIDGKSTKFYSDWSKTKSVKTK